MTEKEQQELENLEVTVPPLAGNPGNRNPQKREGFKPMPPPPANGEDRVAEFKKKYGATG